MTGKVDVIFPGFQGFPGAVGTLNTGRPHRARNLHVQSLLGKEFNGIL